MSAPAKPKPKACANGLGPGAVAAVGDNCMAPAPGVI